MAQGNDLNQASEVYRLGLKERAIGDLQTKLNDYDPRGGTAQELGAQIGRLRAHEAQQHQ